MPNDLSTEADLRDALASLVPEDLDVQDFRARLDGLLAAGQPAGTAPEVADEVLELTPLRTDRPRRRRATRVGVIATVAACAAAVLAIAVAVVPHGHGDRRIPPADPSASVPAVIRSTLLPGTVVLHTYSGQGSRTYTVAPHAVAAHFSYEAYVTCRGSGTLTVAQQVLLSGCRGATAAVGTTNVLQHGRLNIVAPPRTTWQLTLTLTPDARTNGSVQGPVGDDMSGADSEVRQSGQGSASVSFSSDIVGDQPAGPADYRLRLVCHGTGVSLPDLSTTGANRPAVHGLTTRTCFAGREYVWTYVRLTTPASVRVVASAGTTWTVRIDSM